MCHPGLPSPHGDGHPGPSPDAFHSAKSAGLRFCSAAVLRRVTQDSGLRSSLSDAGRVRVRDFGWDEIVRRYERLYAGAAGRSS